MKSYHKNTKKRAAARVPVEWESRAPRLNAMAEWINERTTLHATWAVG